MKTLRNLRNIEAERLLKKNIRAKSIVADVIVDFVFYIYSAYFKIKVWLRK